MDRRYWPFLIFVSALVVRMLGLGVESYWYDEAFTAKIVSLPLADLIAATSGDVHPPLWYVLSWPIAQIFGRSEFWLRLPAAIFSALSALELYKLIGKADQKAALWGSGLMIFSGGMQYYGQEARQYSLLMWLVLSSLRSVGEGKHLRFALTAALSMYTHNLAVVYIAPMAALALWKWRKKAMLPLALAGASYLPWAGVLIRQMSEMAGGGYWIAPGGIGGLIFYWIFGTFGTRMPEWAQLHIILTSIGISLGSLYTLRRDLRSYAPLFLLTFAPAGELFAISQVWQPVMLARGLLPASAGLLGIWGAGIARMDKPARNFALAILLPMMALNFANYFIDPEVQRTPSSEHTSLIEDNWKPGDVIYHTSVGTAVGFDFYLHDYDYAIMPGGIERGGLSPATRSAFGFTEHEAAIETLPGMGYRRAWVIWGRAPNIADEQLARATAIIETYPVLMEWTVLEEKLGAMKIVLVDITGG